MPPPFSGPFAAGNAGAQQDWALRLGRLVAFGRSLSLQLTREFARALEDAGLEEQLADESKDALRGFRLQLDELREALWRAEEALAGAWVRDMPEAGVGGPDEMGNLVAALSGLERQARLLRDSEFWQQRHVPRPKGAERAKPEARPRTAPLPKASVPGQSAKSGLSGVLSRWLQNSEVLARDLEAEPPPAPIDPTLERKRQAYDATVTLAQQIVDYVSPRLLLFKTVAGVLKIPGEPPPWIVVTRTMPAAAEQAAVSPALREWLLPLAKVFLENRRVGRDALVAVVQWEQARPRLAQARMWRDALAAAPMGELPALLELADAGPLRAAVLPLNHLHVTFKGVSLLESLFPAPAGQTLHGGFQRRG